jgi:uncharacterized protein YndB with AHSA1/START domain
MTEQKNLKRRVRERMEKTGQRYTSARSHVVGVESEPFVADPGLSDEKLVEKTGKSWTEWVAILDAWGARERPHGEIAAYVAEEHGIPGWWAQTVTVGYERARGLRAPGQRRGGGYEVTVSKTVAAPLERLVSAFVDETQRERWFPGAPLHARPTRSPRSARFDWEDGRTRVVVWFTDKGPKKSSVAVQHQRLTDADEAEALRAFWRQRLAELKRVLDG